MWSDKPDGGRIYRRSVQGKTGWSATYQKEVDAAEQTIRFWQEIFDGDGTMREIHEKFPFDSGHRKV
jgi:hypothetical protein